MFDGIRWKYVGNDAEGRKFFLWVIEESNQFWPWRGWWNGNSFFFFDDSIAESGQFVW